uniref:Uncharacterized protein n=1 Tax=Thermosporothrix sp. COM3 TaxID=2490863 RepID=A0A455SK56_9CHLR|nr:hypothetical protein KTC_20530 [Thermosporothrix sp. COM3]
MVLGTANPSDLRLALAHITYLPTLISNDESLTAEQLTRLVQQDPGPDYITALRGDFEHFLPLIALFLSLGLLARKWQQGTLTQLALRRPSLVVAFGRLCIVLLYLVILTLIATWNAYALLRKPPSEVTLTYECNIQLRILHIE